MTGPGDLPLTATKPEVWSSDLPTERALARPSQVVRTWCDLVDSETLKRMFEQQSFFRRKNPYSFEDFHNTTQFLFCVESVLSARINIASLFQNRAREIQQLDAQ